MTTETSIHQGRWRRWALAAIVLALVLVAIPRTQLLLHIQPLGIDFLPLWSAGRMAWTAPDKVYDFAAVTGAQSWLLPHLHWPRPYAYPPSALLLLAPFGLMPFWPALGLWIALGLGVFLAAGARLATSSRLLTVALMAAAPAVVLAVVVGQTVLLAAGLATLAMAELKDRPRLAGALFAVAAALKPQAVVLAPVALVACGAFETLASAAAVGALIVAVSAAVFGPARWTEWAYSLAPFQALVERAPGLMAGVITPAGAAHNLGLSGLGSDLWRAAFALGGAAATWWVFRRPVDTARRLGVLLAGGLLITPYAMHYDGSLLAPAAAVIAVQATDTRGWVVGAVILAAAAVVTTPFVGLACVSLFLLLCLLPPPSPRVAAPAGLS